MNIKKLIKINQKINVSKESSGDGPYVSTIQGISGQDFQIDIPLRKSNRLYLINGDKVKISLVVENDLYQFTTTVIGKHFDNIPLYKLLKPEEFKRVQQRKYVRLPLMMNMLYAVKTDEEEEPEYIKGYTLDISGGGLRFLSKKIYSEGTEFDIVIKFPDDTDIQEIEAAGKVVRVVNIPDTGYHISVEFTDILLRNQEILIKYILKETSRSKRLI